MKSRVSAAVSRVTNNCKRFFLLKEMTVCISKICASIFNALVYLTTLYRDSILGDVKVVQVVK